MNRLLTQLQGVATEKGLSKEEVYPLLEDVMIDVLGDPYPNNCAEESSLVRRVGRITQDRARRDQDLWRKIASDFAQSFRGYEKSISYGEVLNESMFRLFATWMSDNKEKRKYRNKHIKLSLRILVLATLHGRCCMIASEILVLLRAGYYEGAIARTRTMHEVLTIEALIAQDYTGELADRYNDSGVFEWLRDSNAYYAVHKGDRGPNYAEARRLEREILRRRGRGMREQYGWARPALIGLIGSTQKIKFTDLERAAGTGDLRPEYLAGNHEIHSGANKLVNFANLDGGVLIPTRASELLAHNEEIARAICHALRLFDLATHVYCRAVAWQVEEYDELLKSAKLSKHIEATRMRTLPFVVQQEFG